MTKKFITENIKTLLYALIIAIFIRSIFIQPFYIPSSSMESTLLVGDRLFVTKFSYGYSKHSFPFSPAIFNGRIMYKSPKRGDVVVFKTPDDNRPDYINTLFNINENLVLYFHNNPIHMKSSNSLKDSGRLSKAEGNRNPYSTSVFFRALSPPCIALT